MSNLTQALSLDDTQLDWVYRHLGHTQSVHKQHYRSMSGFIERVHIGKILLMQDMNVVKRFVGKRLEDVDFSSILKSSTQSQPMEEDERDIVEENEELEEDEVSEENGVSEEDEPVKQKRKVKDKCENARKSKPKKRSGTRVRWNEEELNEIDELFHDHLSNKMIPRKEHVEAAIKRSRKNGGMIWKRSWTVIKSKVVWQFNS